MRNRDEAKPVTLSAGFTLIELVVVIVIIAILASLLLPALSKAKSAATWSVTGGGGRSPTMSLHQ